MPVSLSKRLSVIAGMCRGADRVIDVGCDHGKLAARLLQDNPSLTAVATDISAESLEKARILISSLGFTDRCECVCCDGLEGVEIHSGDYIVMSGMGPEAIDDIIKASLSRFPENIRLVLSPASHHEKLRSLIAEKRFFPIEEYAVYEQGHLYAPGLYVRSGSALRLTPGESASGIIKPDYTDGIIYLKTVQARYEKISSTSTDPQKLFFAQEVCRYISDLIDEEQQ